MSKPSGRPQFIQPRAFYELTTHRASRGRDGIMGAFIVGALQVALISVLPVLLIVGVLNYMANGWKNFAHELLVHWPVTVLPLLLLAVIGGIVGVVRR